MWCCSEGRARRCATPHTLRLRERSVTGQTELVAIANSWNSSRSLRGRRRHRIGFEDRPMVGGLQPSVGKQDHVAWFVEVARAVAATVEPDGAPSGDLICLSARRRSLPEQVGVAI